jgi:hypothetical protein
MLCGYTYNGVDYAAFTNLVDATLFDMNATELKGMYELEKNKAIRDSFTTEDLMKVVKVEKTISVFSFVRQDLCK